MQGYEIHQHIIQTRTADVYRGVRSADRCDVLIKQFREDAPNALQEKIEQQLATLLQLDNPGIVRAIKLERSAGRSALILAGFDGVRLDDFIAEKPLSILDFLHVAINFADIISHLHHHRIIHLDIKPANFLIDPANLDLCLFDMELSSVTGAPSQHDHFMPDSLPYLSPEQTGRTGLAIDYRSDLYSVGVSLYQLLTGRPPFLCGSALEYVHAHLALSPARPDAVNGQLPPALADVLLKLLNKNPEDRYQSAAGLSQDLKYCLYRWQSKREIPPFQLACQDRYTQLRLPDKLYGRERESSHLLQAFEQLGGPPRSPRICLISGAGGTGKSALLNDLRRKLAGHRGWIAGADADQCPEPYSFLKKTVSSLVDQLLVAPPELLTRTKRTLANSLGPSADALLDISSSVHLLLSDAGTAGVNLPGVESPGVDSPGVESPGVESPGVESPKFHRYTQYGFVTLIECMATLSDPLLFCIDNLHRIDLASLSVIEHLLTLNADSDAGPPVMVVATFREGELHQNRPVEEFLDRISDLGAASYQTELGPLSKQDLTQLLQDALDASLDPSDPLVQMVHLKTDCNPNFVHQYLSHLNQTQLFEYIPVQGWCWDVDKIRAAGIPDNVIGLMNERTQRLPHASKRLLQVASVIGRNFDLNLLVPLTGQARVNLIHDIQVAVQEGLLSNVGADYSFSHEAIEDSCYRQLGADEAGRLHSKVATILLNGSDQEALDNSLSAIIRHLDLGTEEIGFSLQHQLAKLSLRAGQRALVGGSWSIADRYFSTGLAYLPDLHKDTGLAFDLTLRRIITQLRVGDRSQEIIGLLALLNRSLSDGQLIQVYEGLISAHAIRREYERMCQLCLELLNRFGFASEHKITADLAEASFAECLRQTESLSADDFLSLPVTTDPRWESIVSIMNSAGVAAYLYDPHLSVYMTSRVITQMLRWGINSQCPFRLMGLTIVLIRNGMYSSSCCQLR